MLPEKMSLEEAVAEMDAASKNMTAAVFAMQLEMQERVSNPQMYPHLTFICDEIAAHLQSGVAYLQTHAPTEL